VHEARWEGEKNKEEGFLMQMYKRERIVCQVKNKFF
jgi:hypothetical protein